MGSLLIVAQFRPSTETRLLPELPVSRVGPLTGQGAPQPLRSSVLKNYVIIRHSDPLRATNTVKTNDMNETRAWV